MAAARKVKRVSPEVSVTEAFCTLLPRPTISPSRTVTDMAERPSQVAENGMVGTSRAGPCGGFAAGAVEGAALRSPRSRRLTSALTVTVGVPLRSTRNSASPASSLEPTFSVVSSTLKVLRKVPALALSA